MMDFTGGADQLGPPYQTELGTLHRLLGNDPRFPNPSLFASFADVSATVFYSSFPHKAQHN